MNWLRIILDGIAMSLVFNAICALFFFIMPHAYCHMMPKEIKEAAKPYTKKELRDLAVVVYVTFIAIIIWMILSTYHEGVKGYWNIFWTIYIEMLFVNFGDFLILDCWLMRIVRKSHRIKGTENCKAWEIKEYMKDAVPEHFIFWPLIICSLVSFLCAKIIIFIG